MTLERTQRKSENCKNYCSKHFILTESFHFHHQAFPHIHVYCNSSLLFTIHFETFCWLSLVILFLSFYYSSSWHNDINSSQSWHQFFTIMTPSQILIMAKNSLTQKSFGQITTVTVLLYHERTKNGLFKIWFNYLFKKSIICKRKKSSQMAKCCVSY